MTEARKPVPSPRASTWRRLAADRRGNFALVTAFLMLPMVLAIGFAVDGSRYYKARAHLQDALDTAALAVAASDEQDTAKLREHAQSFMRANLSSTTVSGVEIASFDASSEDIVLNGSGYVETTFMRLANYERMNVSASTTAKRAPEQFVEVALVLDNTYSMSERDPSTREMRIETLRKASKSLVEVLLPADPAERGTTSIALVPYADHVNVGEANRYASWLQLDRAEGSVTTGEGNHQCTKKEVTVKEYCAHWNTEESTCTDVKDGITETRSCQRRTTCKQYSDKWTEVTCTGSEKVTTHYRFYGCVGSRMSGTLRRGDTNPGVRYPGYAETRRNCAKPIIPLTTDRDRLLTAVAGMTHEVPGYIAQTHIPSGILWGWNVLSPQAPFEEGADYDPNNRNPRKIMIVMTDGDNTLTARSSDGKHVGLSSNTSTQATQRNNVNADTAAVCTNAKAAGIEIYTIAFMVTNETARELLRRCATDDAHFYNANDAGKLTAAFSGIARSISQVRIAQ